MRSKTRYPCALSCKGCKADCPVGVDVATWKAEFRSHHYASRSRPRGGSNHEPYRSLGRACVHLPSLANAVAATAIGKRAAGSIRAPGSRVLLPRLSATGFVVARSSTIGRRPPAALAGHFQRPLPSGDADRRDRVARTRRVQSGASKPAAMLRTPAFRLGLSRPRQAAIRAHPPKLWPATSRMELRSSSSSRLARRPSRTNFATCSPERSEADRLSEQVHYFANFVVDHIDRFPNLLRGGSALVQAHCHHHAVIGFDAEQQLLDKLGLSTRTPGAGVLRNGRCVRDGPGNVRRWSDDRRTCAPASSSPTSGRDDRRRGRI